MPRTAPLVRDKYKLTRKQKAFADELLANPKLSATQAALRTYGKPDKPTTFKTASVIAAENLDKPSVRLYLNQHIEKAKNRVIELIDSEKEDIALRASDSVLDRALGKPTQRVENTSTSVNLNLNLTDIVQE